MINNTNKSKKMKLFFIFMILLTDIFFPTKQNNLIVLF